MKFSSLLSFRAPEPDIEKILSSTRKNSATLEKPTILDDIEFFS
jgi:hypothetical protein